VQGSSQATKQKRLFRYKKMMSKVPLSALSPLRLFLVLDAVCTPVLVVRLLEVVGPRSKRVDRSVRLVTLDVVLLLPKLFSPEHTHQQTKPKKERDDLFLLP
jgi:hypothetical protein